MVGGGRWWLPYPPCCAVLGGLSVILWTGHIIRDRSHGYADEEETTDGTVSGSGKTVITDRGPVRVDEPRDRDGSFEPILIPKHERRFTGFDERIIAMYARGMSVREIQAFLVEHYGTEVSPDFISSVTDEVMAEAELAEPSA